MRLLIALGLFAVSFAIVGCGSNAPKLVTVTGKVMHKGKTVTGGSVWFHPEGGGEGKPEKMSGQLQLDGTFTAQTFPHGDGVPPGKYKVTISRDIVARAGGLLCGEVSTTQLYGELLVNGIGQQ